MTSLFGSFGCGRTVILGRRKACGWMPPWPWFSVRELEGTEAQEESSDPAEPKKQRLERRVLRWPEFTEQGIREVGATHKK